MAGMRAFVILEQVVADLVDHSGALRRRHVLIGVSLYDLSCSLFHKGCIRTSAVATLPGDAAEIAELRFAAAAEFQLAYFTFRTKRR
jgi:hypothetical protein